MTNNGKDFELTRQVDNSKRYFNIVKLNPASATITEDSGNKSYSILKQ